MHRDVEVTRRRTSQPGLTLAGQPDPLAVLDSRRNPHVDGAWSTAVGRGRPAWLSAGVRDFTVTVAANPRREDIDQNINEQLIVELYSK